MDDEYNKNIEAIVSYLKKGECKSKGQKIGLELEHFLVDKESLKTEGYFGERGVRELMEKLEPYYDEKVYVDGAFLGLTRKDAYITLEPASQLEVSIAAKENISQLSQAYQRFSREIEPLLRNRGLQLCYTGYHPVSKIAELQIIPKRRYAYMAEYLKSTGRYALNMMKGTCSAQVSIDYSSEADFMEKFRLANCLSPVLYFLTDHTAVFEGEPAADSMVRARIWDEVDPARCGVVPGALDAPFGYRDYARYIYERPAVVTKVGEELRSTGGTPLCQVFQGRQMREDEVEYALGMFFPDVRVKTYLELRMADSMPPAETLGYAALIKGLFYDERNRRRLLSLFEGADNRFVKELKKNLIEKGADTVLFGKKIADFCIELINYAEKSLGREDHYLEPLRKMAQKKRDAGTAALFSYGESRDLLC